MKLGVLFSGGKDSTLALIKAKEFHEISCLISLISKNKESYMFHTPNIKITKLQAECMGTPIILEETKGEKEKELEDLEKAIKKAIEKYNIKGIVSGAIMSTYQAIRIQKICDKLGLWCFNPLWLMDPVMVLNKVEENNIHAIISGVAGYPLTKDLLGENIINVKKRLISLKNYINPAGEGGELETTVLDCPLFKKRIKIIEKEIRYNNYSGELIIKKVKLEEK